MTEAEFSVLLKAVCEARDDELREQFRRSLPFNDAISDRWERARKLGFGEGASIYGSSMVYGNVHAGAQTWIGPMTLLDGSGGPVCIGAYCSISAGTFIYTHDTVKWAVSGGRQSKRTGAVTIGNCVYIGSQSLVLPNVTIGSRVVVAANSLVNRDIADGVIVAGSPAKPIGRVVGHDDDTQLLFEATT